MREYEEHTEIAAAARLKKLPLRRASSFLSGPVTLL